MNSIAEILFHIDDSEFKKFTKDEVNTAYSIASRKFKEESNRVIYATVLLLDKEILRLKQEMLVLKDSTGVESTQYQTIQHLMSAILNKKHQLQSEYEDEQSRKNSGFAIKAGKTVIEGIND